MEDLQLLKDLGSLGFIDYKDDFFKRLDKQPNVFVTKDIENDYFVQFIFSAQVDPEMLKPKYKFIELTLVYETDKNKFSNNIMIRNARSTISGEFFTIPRFHMDDLGNFVLEWNPDQDIFDVSLEGIPTGPLTQREFFSEFLNYCYYIATER
jgi:hypothetical protein